MESDAEGADSQTPFAPIAFGSQPSGPPLRLPNAREHPFGWIEIDGIEGQDKGSILRPLECTGADGERYFVKILRTDLDPLAREWIAGRVAQEIGLPIPPFRIAWLPPELAAGWREQSYDLVGGWGFASRCIPFADNFPPAARKEVDPNVQIKTLAFDWWIKNLDRSPKNPNILYDRSEPKIWLIDHHQAFGSADYRAFAQSHIFGAEFSKLRSPIFQALVNSWQRTASDILPEICSALPTAWTKTGIMSRVREILGRDWQPPDE